MPTLSSRGAKATSRYRMSTETAPIDHRYVTPDLCPLRTVLTAARPVDSTCSASQNQRPPVCHRKEIMKRVFALLCLLLSACASLLVTACSSSMADEHS